MLLLPFVVILVMFTNPVPVMVVDVVSIQFAGTPSTRASSS